MFAARKSKRFPCISQRCPQTCCSSVGGETTEQSWQKQRRAWKNTSNIKNVKYSLQALSYILSIYPIFQAGSQISGMSKSIAVAQDTRNLEKLCQLCTVIPREKSCNVGKKTSTTCYRKEFTKFYLLDFCWRKDCCKDVLTSITIQTQLTHRTGLKVVNKRIQICFTVQSHRTRPGMLFHVAHNSSWQDQRTTELLQYIYTYVRYDRQNNTYTQTSTCGSGPIIGSSFLSIAEDFKCGVSVHSKSLTGLSVHCAVNLIKHSGNIELCVC